MSLSFDDLVIGGQLRVGTGICPPIKEGDYKINGSASFEGPLVLVRVLRLNLVLREEILMIQIITQVQHQLI